MNPPSPHTAARWPSSPNRRSRWWRFTEKKRRRRGNVRNEEMKGRPVKTLFILTPKSWDCRGEYLSLSLCLSVCLSFSFITWTSTSTYQSVACWKEKERKLDKTAIRSFCRRDFLLMFNFTGWKRAMICLIKNAAVQMRQSMRREIRDEVLIPHTSPRALSLSIITLQDNNQTKITLKIPALNGIREKPSSVVPESAKCATQMSLL